MHPRGATCGFALHLERRAHGDGDVQGVPGRRRTTASPVRFQVVAFPPRCSGEAGAHAAPFSSYRRPREPRRLEPSGVRDAGFGSDGRLGPRRPATRFGLAKRSVKRVEGATMAPSMNAPRRALGQRPAPAHPPTWARSSEGPAATARRLHTGRHPRTSPPKARTAAESEARPELVQRRRHLHRRPTRRYTEQVAAVLQRELAGRAHDVACGPRIAHGSGFGSCSNVGKRRLVRPSRRRASGVGGHRAGRCPSPGCRWRPPGPTSAFTAMEYRAMPRPCMPHLSRCMVSSLEVTRGSNTRSCRAAGMPQSVVADHDAGVRLPAFARDGQEDAVLALRIARVAQHLDDDVLAWSGCRGRPAVVRPRRSSNGRSHLRGQSSTRRWLSPHTDRL